MPILSEADPLISRLKLPLDSWATALPDPAEALAGFTHIGSEAVNEEFARSQMGNWARGYQTVCGSIMQITGAPQGDLDFGDGLFDGMLGYLKIDDPAIDVLKGIGNVALDLFLDKALDYIQDVVADLLADLIDPLVQVIGAIPIYGWIVEAVWDIAFGIVKLVKLFKPEPDPVPEFESAMFSPSADRATAAKMGRAKMARRNPAAVSRDEADVRIDQVLASGRYNASDWAMYLGEDGVIHVRGIVPYPIEEMIRARGLEYAVDELEQDEEIGIIGEAPQANLAYVFLSGWTLQDHQKRTKFSGPTPAARIINPEDWRSTYSNNLPIYVAIDLNQRIPAGRGSFWRDQFVVFDESGISHAKSALAAWFGTPEHQVSVNTLEPGSLEWRYAIAIAREATERINIYQWAKDTATELGLHELFVVVPTDDNTDVRKRVKGAKRASRSVNDWDIMAIEGPTAAVKEALQRITALADKYGKNLTVSHSALSRSKDYKRLGFVPDEVTGAAWSTSVLRRTPKRIASAIHLNPVAAEHTNRAHKSLWRAKIDLDRAGHQQGWRASQNIIDALEATGCARCEAENAGSKELLEEVEQVSSAAVAKFAEQIRPRALANPGLKRKLMR